MGTDMKKPCMLFVYIALLFLTPTITAQELVPHALPPRAIGSIERLDPMIDQLIATDATIEVVADGFAWSEGPVWLSAQQHLLFSDVPTNTIYSWSEQKGLSVYLKPSGSTGYGPHSGESGSNGLAIDHQGELILCQHGDRRVAKMEGLLTHPKSKYTTIADKYQGKRFNSPNDLVIHSNGTIFFTDPPYGLAKQLEDPKRELEFQGVYKIEPSGVVTLMTKELPMPNGIALSHDEQRLYVAQSHRTAKIIMAYDLDKNLDIKKEKLFFDANTLGKVRAGDPDGLKTDRKGNLFATGPGGVLVINAQGKHLGTIMTGERIANCAFDDKGSTLYMTSDRYICRIKINP